MNVYLASTPTISFPCQGVAATGQAPGSLTIRAEEACPSYRLPCQTWRRAALDPNICYIRLHSCSSVQDRPVTSFVGNIEAFAHLALQPFA